MLYLCFEGLLAVGGKTLVTMVLGLYWLGGGGGGEVHVWFFCTFQLVSGACGEQGLWSLSDWRNVFSLQIRVFQPIPFTVGGWAYWKVSYVLRMWFPAALVFARPLLSSLQSHSVSPGDGSGHFTLVSASLQALGPSSAGWQLLFELCPSENIIISTARYPLVVGRWER